MTDFADFTMVRGQLEKLLGADMRQLTSDADWMQRSFAAQNGLTANDFRALLFVIIADATGERVTAGDLRRRMGLSGAAITYLVERLTESGHLRREADPSDRRKVILRCAEPGMAIARTFLLKIDGHSRHAFEGLTDAELQAAHRTFAALVDAMSAFRAETLNHPRTVTHHVS